MLRQIRGAGARYGPEEPAKEFRSYVQTPLVMETDNVNRQLEQSAGMPLF
jgi:hypothetical protein